MLLHPSILHYFHSPSLPYSSHASLTSLPSLPATLPPIYPYCDLIPCYCNAMPPITILLPVLQYYSRYQNPIPTTTMLPPLLQCYSLTTTILSPLLQCYPRYSLTTTILSPLTTMLLLTTAILLPLLQCYSHYYNNMLPPSYLRLSPVTASAPIISTSSLDPSIATKLQAHQQ